MLWDFPNSHLTGCGTEEREGGRIVGGMQRRWARGVNRGHIKEQDKKRVRLLRIELKQVVKTVSAYMLEVS